jgi:hypothetical protein
MKNNKVLTMGSFLVLTLMVMSPAWGQKPAQTGAEWGNLHQVTSHAAFYDLRYVYDINLCPQVGYDDCRKQNCDDFCTDEVSQATLLQECYNMFDNDVPDYADRRGVQCFLSNYCDMNQDGRPSISEMLYISDGGMTAGNYTCPGDSPIDTYPHVKKRNACGCALIHDAYIEGATEDDMIFYPVSGMPSQNLSANERAKKDIISAFFITAWPQYGDANPYHVAYCTDSLNASQHNNDWLGSGDICTTIFDNRANLNIDSWDMGCNDSCAGGWFAIFDKADCCCELNWIDQRSPTINIAHELRNMRGYYGVGPKIDDLNPNVSGSETRAMGLPWNLKAGTGYRREHNYGTALAYTTISTSRKQICRSNMDDAAAANYTYNFGGYTEYVYQAGCSQTMGDTCEMTTCQGYNATYIDECEIDNLLNSMEDDFYDLCQTLMSTIDVTSTVTNFCVSRNLDGFCSRMASSIIYGFMNEEVVTGWLPTPRAINPGVTSPTDIWERLFGTPSNGCGTLDRDPSLVGCPGERCSCPSNTYCWCDTEYDNWCPVDWNGACDGCDEGCQFTDADCWNGPECKVTSSSYGKPSVGCPDGICDPIDGQITRIWVGGSYVGGGASYNPYWGKVSSYGAPIQSISSSHSAPLYQTTNAAPWDANLSTSIVEGESFAVMGYEGGAGTRVFKFYSGASLLSEISLDTDTHAIVRYDGTGNDDLYVEFSFDGTAVTYKQKAYNTPVTCSNADDCSSWQECVDGICHDMDCPCPNDPSVVDYCNAECTLDRCSYSMLCIFGACKCKCVDVTCPWDNPPSPPPPLPAPPPGECTVISGDGSWTGSTTGESDDYSSPSCNGNNGTPDVCFEWTPIVSGTYEFSTCGSQADFDTVLSLHNISTNEELTCNDDVTSCTTEKKSLFSYGVTGGTTYKIILDGYYGGDHGDYDLNITASGGCTPDCTGKNCGDDGCGGSCGTCSGGQVCNSGVCEDPPASGCTVISGAGTYTGDTTGESNDYSGTGSDCDDNHGDAPDVCYQWTPTVSGEHNLSLCNSGTFYDTILMVWNTDSSSQLICNDDGPGCSDYQSSTDFNAVAGTTYIIVVDGFREARFGEFDLVITAPSGCSPDCSGKNCGDDGCGGSCGTCSGGQTCQSGVCSDPPASGCTVISGAGTYTGDTTGESNDYSGTGSDCDDNHGDAPDVCYQWTPTVSGEHNLSLCNSGTFYDTVLMVWNADSSSQLICNDDGPGCSDYQSSTDFNAVAGTTYIIVVDGFREARFGEFDLVITAPSSCSPDCSGKNCGDDGCGGSCGSCSGGQVCNSGTCEDPPASGCTSISGAGSWSGSTAGGTDDYGVANMSDCDDGNTGVADACYSWTATTSGTHVIDLCDSGTDFDTILNIRNADGSSILACNDDDNTNCSASRSRLSFDATSGTTYTIVVDGYNGTGNYVLNIAAP